MLSMAAVIGRTFDLAVLSTIADRPEDDVLDVLEQAVNAALITEVGELPGRFRFEHALIEHTLYQDLSATRRQRLHQRIAQALETMMGEHAPPVSELAHHWLVATQPADAAKAIEYARLAGEAALDALAPLDAVRWFSQALELQERQLSGESMIRCDLLIGLGAAQRLAGDPAEQATLLEAAALAQAADDTDRLVRVALAVAHHNQVYDADEARITTIRAALDCVERESIAAARLLAALACELDPRDEAVVASAREAIEIAQRIGDERTLLWVLIATYSATSGSEDVEVRRARVKLAVDLADRLDDRLAAFNARFQLHSFTIEDGDHEASRVLRDDLTARVAALGLPYLRWQLMLVESAMASMVGHLAEAEAIANAALELAGTAGLTSGMGAYGGQLFMLRFIQGRIDELVDFFLDAVAAMPAIEPLRVAVIVMLNELGDFEGAAERLAQERSRGFTSGGEGLLNSQIDLADVAVDLGDLDVAAMLLDRMAPAASRMAFVTAVAPRPVARAVGRLEGALGRYDQAEAAFATALELCERFGAVYWAGRTHVERAEMYARRADPGDRERAERDLDAALQFAARCQGVSIERRVERVRADLG
jgi:tetratricopeptide (TPR) repeat protein